MRVLIRTIAVLHLLLMLQLAQVGAAPTESYHFGMKKSTAGAPASIGQEPFASLVDHKHVIYLDEQASKSGRKVMYLTFDSGYENGSTAHILDVLRDKHVPATFFLAGHYVVDQPELVRRMMREGHRIGNHSWSHPDMTTLQAAGVRQELSRLESTVHAVTGEVSSMTDFRPPRGIFSRKIIQQANEAGYRHVFWSIAYKDWETERRQGWQHAFQQVTKQFHPGAIILLHSVSKDNAEAMRAIINEAERQGYTFASLDKIAK